MLLHACKPKSIVDTSCFSNYKLSHGYLITLSIWVLVLVIRLGSKNGFHLPPSGYRLRESLSGKT